MNTVIYNEPSFLFDRIQQLEAENQRLAEQLQEIQALFENEIAITQELMDFQNLKAFQPAFAETFRETIKQPQQLYQLLLEEGRISLKNDAILIDNQPAGEALPAILESEEYSHFKPEAKQTNQSNINAQKLYESIKQNPARLDDFLELLEENY